MLVRQILGVFVVAGLLAVCGCAPSIVGTDAGVYSTGKLYAVTSHDMTAVYNATLKALEQLEINVTENAKDVFYAKVVAEGADGKRIVVRIKPTEGSGTDLNIKVGAFGDEHRSSIIYERIRQNLGASDK